MRNHAAFIGWCMVFLLISSALVLATPAGPTVTYIDNQTATPKAPVFINTTGGSISTVVFNTTTQNIKWKAFVGNVTGALALRDAAGYSVYDWSLSTVAGEVYATRKSSVVSWTSIACGNSTHLINESRMLNHTSNPDDNVTKTFNTTTHDTFFVGTIPITANSCFALHTNVNNQSQSATFDEVVLYDGGNATNGSIVYAAPLEQNALGYNNQPYDFQMIVPEVATPGWSSSTAYYFYVELT